MKDQVEPVEFLKYQNPNGLPMDPVKSVVRSERKIGRNELCPCGSGLKYKKCCIDKE